MSVLFSKNIFINQIERTIEIVEGDITLSTDNYDLLFCSSFANSRYEMKNTIIGSLKDKGIDVDKLFEESNYNFNLCNHNLWISEAIPDSLLCKRIACLGLKRTTDKEIPGSFIEGLFNFVSNIISNDYWHFHLHHIAMPLFGTGYMQIDTILIARQVAKVVERSLQKNKELTKITLFGLNKNNLLLLKKEIDPIFNEKYDVFISHSTKDDDKVKKLADSLRLKNIKVWVDDEQIRCGADFKDKMYSAVKNSLIFLVALSKYSDESVYVNNEVDLASGLKKTILPYSYSDDFKALNLFNKYFKDNNVFEARKVDESAFSEEVKKAVELEKSKGDEW